MLRTNTSCSDSQLDRVLNLETLLKSPTTSQVFASRVIATSGDGALATLGPRKKLLFKPVAAKHFSADDMFLIQKDLNLSKRELNTLAQDLRLASRSMKTIEPGLKGRLKETVRDKSHQLDSFFQTKRNTRFIATTSQA